MPGFGGVAHRTPDDLRAGGRAGAPLAGAATAVLVAGALGVAWLIANPRTPDLAAATYRVELVRRFGFIVWDDNWYAGHHLAGYSLLFGPLAALLGLRLLAVLSVLASSVLFARITSVIYGRGARPGAALFAVAAVGDIWIGRLAFALGVSLALGSVLALIRRRSWTAAVLAALCSAASPVAGALLVLAAFTHAVSRRSVRAVVALAVPAAGVAVSLALLFPEGGSEPYPIVSFAATALVMIAFLWALPRGETLLRDGAVIYLGVCALCLAVPSPMGSNIERYGVLLAGPLLLCAVRSARGASRRRTVGARGRRARRWRATPPLSLVVAALCGWGVWVVWGPARETLAVWGNESTSAAYYVPVERFLSARGGGPVRVEVPLTRSHWEAALLAPEVALARGWDKQQDERFDGVLLRPGLDAASYRRWLSDQAVSYVALPDTRLDPSSAREGALIRAGLPYLREVLESTHWRIYEVRSPTPILTGPGRLTSLGHDSFALQASAAGTFEVRVHFTRYWALSSGAGCVRKAPGDWTSVTVSAPGKVIVSASFSLGRALGLAGSCRTEPASRS
jgi:hypothetical protein